MHKITPVLMACMTIMAFIMPRDISPTGIFLVIGWWVLLGTIIVIESLKRSTQEEDSNTS